MARQETNPYEPTSHCSIASQYIRNLGVIVFVLSAFNWISFWMREGGIRVEDALWFVASAILYFRKLALYLPLAAMLSAHVFFMGLLVVYFSVTPFEGAVYVGRMELPVNRYFLPFTYLLLVAAESFLVWAILAAKNARKRVWNQEQNCD